MRLFFIKIHFKSLVLYKPEVFGNLKLDEREKQRKSTNIMQALFLKRPKI